MAKFIPPFGTSADLRFPTNDEQQVGFPCGPADREMFNGMFHRLEAEMGEVIAHAGITGSNEDLTQLRQAIQLLISTAIGQLPEEEQPDLTGFLLLNQARARLPIYPEVLNADGRIIITSPVAGTIRVPGGVMFQHRGIFPVTTVQEDFTTVASKTYHLRWQASDGKFYLRDLADSTYNPSSAPETDRRFDSAFDDMLVARVLTNSNNNATITNYANKNRLEFAQYTGRMTDNIVFSSGNTGYGNYAARRENNTFTYNFARTPVVTSINAIMGSMAPGPTGFGIHGVANVIYDKVVSRNSTRFTVLTDYNQTNPPPAQFYCEIDFQTLV